MQFYLATRFLFPRHYERRLLLVCFLAVHLPLIACVAILSWRHDWDLPLLAVLLVATLVGTIGAIWSISALLAPVRHAVTLLQTVQRGEDVGAVPPGGDDIVGRLLQGVAHAASETTRRIDRLKDAAERDVLTGLRNRRGFLDAIRPVLDGHRDSVLAIVDLDRFKRVNDEYGHDRGDSLLADFAEHLASSIRRSDIAARWGGEEFAILFPDTSLSQASDIVERMQASMAGETPFLVGRVQVTFSCGMARVRDPAGLDDAMRAADSILYAAKQGGRNLVLAASD